MMRASVLLLLAASCGVDANVLVDRASDPGTSADAGGGTSPPFPRPDAGAPAPTLEVFASVDFTCALAKGIPLCWGRNDGGALGTGDTVDRSTPTRVATDVVFDTLAPGQNHTCGIENGTGRVLCWGDAARGQLGQGDTVRRLAPVVVPLPDVAIELASGFDHTCAVLRSGALHCWGSNLEGELAQGVNGDRSTPVRVGGDSDWMTVSAGQGHTCALRRPGDLWCWGRNTAGQVGIGGPPVPPDDQQRVPRAAGTRGDFARIDLGQDSACGITSGGSLHCWGANDVRNLGVPDPVLYVPTQVEARTDWMQVSADCFDTCAITRGTELLCAGRNIEGQLGLGDNTDRGVLTRVRPEIAWRSVSMGRFHMCATSVDRRIWCAGTNSHGELGKGDMAGSNTLVNVPLPDDLDPVQ